MRNYELDVKPWPNSEFKVLSGQDLWLHYSAIPKWSKTRNITISWDVLKICVDPRKLGRLQKRVAHHMVIGLRAAVKRLKSKMIMKNIFISFIFRTDQCVNESTRKPQPTDEWIRSNGWMDEMTDDDGLMGRWTDGCIDKCMVAWIIGQKWTTRWIDS